MRKKTLNLLLIPFLILIFSSFGLAQRQTGSLKGSVVDDEGNPLPGVTVTITSPAMQGQQSYITTTHGDFRFPACPPGTYLVRCALSAFQTVSKPGVTVSIGKTTTISIQMKPSALEEEITVTAGSPVIDVESSGMSITLDKEAIESLPIIRDILEVYKMAPAMVGRKEINDSQKAGSVHGGALQDTGFSIDGVSLVDPSRGYIMAEVAYDAIDEVEMSLAGHKAEVDEVSAGYINVVTKSGGNEFSGALTVGGTHKSVTEQLIPPSQIEGIGLEQMRIYRYRFDVGASFGGPIIKDKVWFFLAPRYDIKEGTTAFVPFTDPDGINHPTYPYVLERYTAMGKITAQITSNLRWLGMYQYNYWMNVPDAWAIEDPYTPLESQPNWGDNAHVATSVLTYVINQNTYLEARFGMVRRHMTVPFTGEWEGPADRAFHYDKETERYWGMSGNTPEHYFRNSYDFKLDLTRFQDDFLGADHEFKAGVKYVISDCNMQYPRPNPYFYYWYDGTPWYYGDVEPYKGMFEIESTSTELGQREHKAGMRKYSAYFQDTVSIGKRLTLNLGVRYNEAHGFIPAQHYVGFDDIWEDGLANILLPEIFGFSSDTLDSPEVGDISVYKSLSPRLGFSFDLFGTEKTMLKGSFARYAEAMFVTALEDLVPLMDKFVEFTWWDLNQNGELDLPPIDRYENMGYEPYSTDVEPIKQKVASDVNAPYTDEWTLGIEHSIGPDLSISLKYVGKSFKNGLGERNLDITKDSKWWIPYTVTEPGYDEEFGTGDDQNLTVYALDENCPEEWHFQQDNIDEAWRKYWGFDLIVTKRMSHGWMFNGSITYNKAWGNFQSGYLDYAGWQNFWDPNSDINRVGRLEFDRPLIIKLMGSVQLPYGFSLSAFLRHFSGSHWTRETRVYFPDEVNGYFPLDPSVTVNAEERNNRSHAPSTELDLRLEKSFRFGRFKVNVWADGYNLLGHSYFEYWGSHMGGGRIYPDGSYTPNPGRGVPSNAFGARYLALGARISF